MLASAAHASAQVQDGATPAAPVSIAWDAPSECPDRAAFAAELERLLGRPPADAGRHEIAIAAHVHKGERDFALTMATRVDGETGTREMTAASCAELMRAAALIAALGIDPEAGRGTGTATPKDDTPPAPANPPAPTPASTPPSTPAKAAATQDSGAKAPTPEPLGLTLRFAPAVDWGSLPSVAGGVELGVGVRREAWQVELVGYGLPGVQTRFAKSKNARVELHELRAAGVGCAKLGSVPEARLSACARTDYGRVWGKSFGVSAAAAGGSPWLSVGLGLRGGLALASALDLVLDVGADLALQRSRFRVQGLGIVHETPLIVGRTALGLALRL
jgi:hypothetical protein